MLGHCFVMMVDCVVFKHVTFVSWLYVDGSHSAYRRIMDFSKQASTGPLFLLHDRGPYSKCVAASGPWPQNAGAAANRAANDGPGRYDDNIEDDDSNPFEGSYVTCFTTKINSGYAVQRCWSKSYLDTYNNWQPCKPKGFGSVWEFGVPANDVNTNINTPTCGTPCTAFN